MPTEDFVVDVLTAAAGEAERYQHGHVFD